MVSQWNSSGIFSQDSPRCSSATKVQEFLSKMSEVPEDFTGWIIFMSMFNDISWGSQDNEQECESTSSFLFVRKNFHQENGHSSDLDQKRSGILLMIAKPQGEWDRVAELMILKFGESGHPVFRASSPLPRGTLKIRGSGKLSIHSALMGERLKLFFAQLFLLINSVSTEQSQICVRNTKPAM